MQKILFILRKEFKQIFRTREMIGIIFGIPLVQLVVLGFAITNEVKHVSLILGDQDNSQYSREILRSFNQTDRFDIVSYESDFTKVQEMIQAWEAQVAVIIPPDFGKDLQSGQTPAVQIIIDGIDGNTAGIAVGNAQGILNQFVENNFPGQQRQVGLQQQKLVSMETRMWYNDNLDSAQYMIPGIVVVLITVISMMLSAINLVREKEIGTLEQLMVTPLNKYQILTGKLLPFLILTFIEMTIVLIFAKFIFSISIQGSFLLFAALSLLYLFTTLGLGIFVSTITATQQQAMFISWFIMVFTLLMSGFFIPIENMPGLLQDITYLNPMRYFMYITRDIIQKGSGFIELLQDVIPMTIYGVLIFLFGVLNFRKRAA